MMYSDLIDSHTRGNAVLIERQFLGQGVRVGRKDFVTMLRK